MSRVKRGRAKAGQKDRRRTNLPRPTPEDVKNHPDRVRALPNGGYAWLCHHCRMLASSASKDGTKYLCYRHGGNRAVQRDPVERAKAIEAGKDPPKPSGGQVKHGYYQEGEVRSVHELVAAYQAAGLDPDDTDPDMMHLRARLENLMRLEPLMTKLAEALEEYLTDREKWLQQPVEDGGKNVTVEQVLLDLDRMDDYRRAIAPVRDMHREAKSWMLQMERRHETIIKMARLRADTRLKNKAAEELSVFVMMVRRLMIALSEQLPPDVFAALQKRFERDLSEVHVKTLEVPAVVKPPD